jgi:SAM-dependent methyltransferase
MSSLKKVYQFIIPQSFRALIHNSLWKVKALSVVGNNVNCNCCGKNFSKFLDYGDYKKRKNAICPNCLALERTRLLWFFLEKSPYLSKKNILQFAPLKIIENNIIKNTTANYISGDIDPFLAMKKVDITNICFDENSFDVILCSHVLSVVKEDIKAIKELYRVLKPKGILIFQEFIFNKFDITYENFTLETATERYETYGKHYLMRCYGKDFTQRFLKEGFSVKIFDPKKALTKHKIKRHGLQNSGVIYLFTKDD